MSTLTPKEEQKLCQHIAAALGEPDNYEYYLKFAAYIPKEFLLEKLAYVLSRSDIENKAAYFNPILKSYGRPRNSRR